MQSAHISNKPKLALSFDNVLQRVAITLNTESGRTLAAFAMSILEGYEFDFSKIDQLENESDQLLCTDLFDDCMNFGLSEEDRREAFDAFALYINIQTPGTRH